MDSVKKFARQIETKEGVLIIDDTVKEKPHMDENNIMCPHHDHFQKRTLINYIHKAQRLFIMPLKSNHKVAFSQADKAKGNYPMIESLAMEDQQVLSVYVEAVDFPLFLTTQVFQNKDGSEVKIYLVTK